MIEPKTALLEGLRERLGIDHAIARHGVLPFGDARVDACLGHHGPMRGGPGGGGPSSGGPGGEGPGGEGPGGKGLALGALHEVTGTGIEAETGAIAASFIACLLSRMSDERPIFWIAPSLDLHAPGLLAYGLDPGRIVRVQTRDDPQTLGAMEAVLREGSAMAVVGEAGRLPRIASRRLQLACLKHGSTGFLLHRWPYGHKAGRVEASAAMTQWRLSPAPSAAEYGEPGVPCWRVELLQARGGMEGAWIMQAGETDAAHPVRVVTELADIAAASPGHRYAG